MDHAGEVLQVLQNPARRITKPVGGLVVPLGTQALPLHPGPAGGARRAHGRRPTEGWRSPIHTQERLQPGNFPRPRAG